MTPDCYFSPSTGLYYNPDGTLLVLPKNVPNAEIAYRPKSNHETLLSNLVAELFYERNQWPAPPPDNGNMLWDEEAGEWK